MSKRLSIQDVIEAAIEIGETTRPTTDLCMHLRQKHQVSDRVAMSAYERALSEGAIVQNWSTRWAKNVGTHAVGMYRVQTSYCTWTVSSEEGQECHT